MSIKQKLKNYVRPHLFRWRERWLRPLLGTAVLDAQSLDLLVFHAARALAGSGDHRQILPTDAVQPPRSPEKLRIGYFGNIANNAYIMTRCLRYLGYDAELVIEDGLFDAFLMNRPFWEDVDVECNDYEEGLSQEYRWKQPHFVRRVAFDPELQAQYAGRLSAVSEVQYLYCTTFERELPPDRALLLAQHMGHWPYLLAMKRYDVIQFSGAPIMMGPFCPKPYVVFPTGGDLYISPFEETLLGLLMRAGYRGAGHVFYGGFTFPAYLDRFASHVPRLFQMMFLDTDTYCPGLEPEMRTRWQQSTLGGRHFMLSSCRQSWLWKGNDRLLRAFNKVSGQTDNGWRMILLEWGPDVARTKSLIAELGLEKKVLWEKLSSKPILRRRQRAADLVVDQLVMPGYGTNVMEAMAAARPVMIKFGEADNREVTEIPPVLAVERESDLDQVLARAMSDTELRETQGGQSREYILRWHGYKNPRNLVFLPVMAKLASGSLA